MAGAGHQWDFVLKWALPPHSCQFYSESLCGSCFLSFILTFSYGLWRVLFQNKISIKYYAWFLNYSFLHTQKCIYWICFKPLSYHITLTWFRIKVLSEVFYFLWIYSVVFWNENLHRCHCGHVETSYLHWKIWLRFIRSVGPVVFLLT